MVRVSSVLSIFLFLVVVSALVAFRLLWGTLRSVPFPVEINKIPTHAIPQNDMVARRVTLVQVVDPKIMKNLTFGNKTSFEILEDAIGCNARRRVRKKTRQCQHNCGGRLETLNSSESWCRINCGCTTFTCLLGNPPPMPTVSEIHVYPPPAGASDRLIPRIIHQTWKEPITKARYPRWSEFQQSFMEQEGYEYQFYADSEARGILQKHFPPEVVSAYDDLLPGAFKADLFRYCVLLIYGGVYADIDILMASQLDDLIKNNTGFVVAVDKLRFSPSNGALCLWNGLLAASPGHPYLAKTIENIVNVVRNRYNQVDLAHMVSCPLRTTNDLEMTTYAVLLATGPCMLGLSVNQASGRHEQSYFEVGEEDGSSEIPGTIKYLFFGVVQNKSEKSCERNILHNGNVVLLTNATVEVGNHTHYSNAVKGRDIFGTQGVYRDLDKARNIIRVVVHSQQGQGVEGT